MKYGQKLKLRDAHVTPRYIQEVQASKLGDAQGIPIFINKTSGYFTGCYIFIASYTMCCYWSIGFFFQFSLVSCCSTCLDPRNTCFGEIHAPLSCLKHSSFHSRCSLCVHVCQHCVQVLFSTLMLLRACQFSQFTLQLGSLQLGCCTL